MKGVIYGMLDLNRKIRRDGVLFLRTNGVLVESFPAYLTVEVEELNQPYINQHYRTKIRYHKQ
jgi:pyrimidine deaminase RibD-like protein